MGRSGTTPPGDLETLRARCLERVREITRLTQDACDGEQRLVLVSAELGAGPAPARFLERVFREAVGIMNQHLAALCPTVLSVQAGLAQVLKGG